MLGLDYGYPRFRRAFDSGEGALGIPFELEANVIFLRLSVNGSPSLSFILDTGAYSIISTRHAKSLGMGLHRVGKTDSIGAEPQDVHLVTDKTLFDWQVMLIDSARVF